MVLKIYNTLTRKKEVFKPLNSPKVGMYTCGPTVYWYQHIGNLRAYVFADTLKRVLKFNNFKVKHVINVTDVGHLVSDADEGEDKIEKAAKKEGKTAEEISNYYFKIFKEDFEKLNIIEPEIWSKATEHIQEQISLIKKIERKGYTYKTSDGIYFDTSKFKDYAKLGRLNVKGLEAGKRVSIGEKKNPTDFALWKFSENPGERQQEWESPWGLGFPGWHIECSAMASKYLGEQFDIHTGGEDHVQVHHTNEIAQSEVAFGKKPWVKYWMHNAFLTSGGEKVSKSKGGLYTISELEEKGFDALIYRYFLLTCLYRKQLDFDLDNLNTAKNSYERLKNICSELKDDKKENKNYLKEFETAINDDLNTPKALQVLWGLVRDKDAKGKYQTVKKIDTVFGLELLKKDAVIIPADVMMLVEERDMARKSKDWTKADKLREKIKKLGWQVDDKDETIVKKI
ncbi:MAG: cysteine--tRNA ligase [Nanoarchaeota archaeon]|nr:cysteine--tRNA ligase [Nanoarchaeota archaeon]